VVEIDTLLALIYTGYGPSILASVITIILSILAIRRSGERTRIKLIIGAFFCFAEAMFAAVVIMFSYNSEVAGFSVVSLGLFGFQMFMLSETIITDSHIDNGDKKYRKYRIMPLGSVILAIGLIILCVSSQKERIVSSIILLLPLLPIFYFSTKHLIFPDKRPKPKSFIMKFVPIELFFYVADLLSYTLWFYGYTKIAVVVSFLESLSILAMGIVIFTEFRRWEE